MTLIQLDVQPPSDQSINWKQLVQLLSKELPNIDTRELYVKQFTTGYSNLTYLLSFNDKEMVMRRPPFGEIPPRAHDMEREYKILKKVHPYFSLAPEPYLYVEEDDISEKHFYIMEKKEGIVLDDCIPPEIQHVNDIEVKASHALIDTLVNLHSIDIYETNLVELGRPEGYLKRQVKGWIKRYHASIVDNHLGIDKLIRWLQENIPSSPTPAIVHNDMKLNNMMLSEDDLSKAIGVFDWELCSVGDPLLDLAGSIAYWTEPGDAETGLVSVTQLGGFLSRNEMVQQYAVKSGRNIDGFDYYLSFAFFKIAVILQQIYSRYKKGELKDERFHTLNKGIANLIDLSMKAKQDKILR
ncbi:phosphotransferase family protein [Alkalihalophilus marmarensis]|uniref:Aminoglycoside phosphotransferase domain-containing protein n=1 Tax=Alkalihalophilus marmarensis DSM 21297 TaxID=1188261 RepID=U6SVA9_9BACI|nr:phosphotransferase family protein [Alkalihalophilus marmarensis]ERN54596.1 hypothetical protein A33I_04435 [Alkalihalophilus marmarensis DSM 21297]MCM3488866.1 phosphotransferase family protein [Alkalihalophilus marmarensis]